MNTVELPECLVSEVNGIEQHFYVGGTVTFDPKPWVNSEALLITALDVENNAVELTGGGQVTMVPLADNAEIRVLEIPQEVRAEVGDKHQVAPFKLADDYDYADDVLYWQWSDATTAARLHCEDIEGDCQVINAYHNDVEYFEYEEPEEDEEEYDADEELEEDDRPDAPPY